MARDYTDVPDLETARRLLIVYDETTRKCADEIERLVGEISRLLDCIARIDGAYATMFSIVEALQQKES